MVDREGRVGAMGCGVWGGRGNLRENREDPAPTVGIAVALRAKYRPFLPRRHAHTMHHACRPPMGTYVFLQRRGMGREGTRGWAGNSLSARPYSTSPTKGAMANLAIDRNGIPFYHDAARRVATFFEKWNFLIETYLHERRGKNPDKRLPSTGLSPRFPFWNTVV